MTLRASVIATDSVTWETRREFFEQNPKIKWLIIAITIGSPFVGLVFVGVLGLVIGFVLGFLSYLLRPYAVTKVREIERGSAK